MTSYDTTAPQSSPHSAAPELRHGHEEEEVDDSAPPMDVGEEAAVTRRRTVGRGFESPVALRVEVHLVGGEAGRALAAAQGRALRDLLEVLAETEVGQGTDQGGGTP